MWTDDLLLETLGEDFSSSRSCTRGSSVSSHARFRAKHGLPFTLLADADHEVAELYGVWVEKTADGKTSMGIKRSTFVIDETGKVAKAMLGVKPDGHADLVLSALRG